MSDPSSRPPEPALAVDPYAVVVGEALVDLIEVAGLGEAADGFRPLVGGAPLNVAVGLARLGTAVQFVGAVGTDALGSRVWRLLHEQGVGTRCCVPVDEPTTIALTSLRDGVPDFTFYGDSFARLGPADVDRELVAGAAVLAVGSIALLYPGSRAAAEHAWSIPSPLKVLDPNVRPRLLRDPPALRQIIEDFTRTADLVKLSEPDARVLFDLDPAAAASHLRSIGARAVVVTLGAAGAYASVDGGTFTVAPPAVAAIDTTGAGDACLAALCHGLVADGFPTSLPAWRDLVEFATAAAALACEVPGAATAMPSPAAIAQARRA